MNSFVFNGFKQKFLNGEVPSEFTATFLPMNDEFTKNFTNNDFSVEQFRTISDLSAYDNEAYDASKLNYAAVEYTWNRIVETDEQIKPMYINADNYAEFTASEYWGKCNVTADVEKYKDSGFFILRTKEEMNWFANSVNEGNNGIIGVLFDNVTDNINESIGKDESIPFQGILDGNGYALNNNVVYCSAIDNGLVGVLGKNGIIKNFVISNENENITIKGLKQINLNYLKAEASDINCGMLVGKNYGTVSNILLSGSKDNSYAFCFHGFIPQVYSVTNKSDEVSNFLDIRKKYDNGENYNFLNSWCINSPGNICPYVGYFAEGIFAQQSYGVNDAGETVAIEYNPKVKPYFHTGSEETSIEITNNNIDDIEFLAFYIKYDWFHDYVFDPNKNDIAGINYRLSLNVYDYEKSKNNLDYTLYHQWSYDDDDGSQGIFNHYIFDNLYFRKTELTKNGETDTLGMLQTEIDAIKSDPTWMSFNDDPKGRNAVAFIKYKTGDTDDEYIILEVNGTLLTNSSGGLRFNAGYLNTSMLPSPVSYNPTNEDKEYGYEIDDGNKKLVISNGYAINEGKVYRLKSVNKTNIKSVPSDAYGEEYQDAEFDISDSVRAFNKSGTEIKLKSINSFSFNILRPGGGRQNITNSSIYTNVCFDTNKSVYHIADENCDIKFASKLLTSYKLKNGQSNNTHNKSTDESQMNCLYYYSDIIKTQNAKFNSKFFGIENEDELIFEDLYALSKEDFPSAATWTPEQTKNRFCFHVNDYKQFIASNYFSGHNFNKHIEKLLKALNGKDNNNNELIRRCFEKVYISAAKHEKLTDAEIRKYKNYIYDALISNLNAFLRHEIDYTNITYASELKEDFNLKNFSLEKGTFDESGWYCCSRHFIFDDNFNSNNWNVLREHLKNRPYSKALTIKDTGFYGKLDLDNSIFKDAGIPYYSKTCLLPLWPIQYDTSINVNIEIESFDFNSFIYSPFVSCSPATEQDYNIYTEYNSETQKPENYLFDAGVPYPFLISGPGGVEHKENLYRAAELYVKNPAYYGLDTFGRWTTMCVRKKDMFDNDYNQLNFNWNIIKNVYENVYNDPEEPERDDLLWKGIYYDENVYPVYSSGNEKQTDLSWRALNEAGDDNKDYDKQYARESLIPRSLLNKPIRMHNMVRAAYNISPIVGANYGTISNVSGSVSMTNKTNFVGFIGTVAGKNVNGDIHDVSLKINYDLSIGNYTVKYKNTPLLPYAVTKNINIPDDPNSDPEYYSTFPMNADCSLSDRQVYSDIVENVNCISLYDKTTYYKNPQFVADKTEYDAIKDFRYFTSAWYDNGETNSDDVIDYKLKSIYVIGGVVGRCVASNAGDGITQKVSNIKNIKLSINEKPYKDDAVDIHSCFGNVIGKVDIQTTDTNFDINSTSELIQINNVSCDKDKLPLIGYVEYQPIDLNTVVALRDGSRSTGDDYFGSDTHTVFTIDMPINLDMKAKDDIFSIAPPKWSTINQSSGAFISTNLSVGNNAYMDGVDVYYKSVFNNVIQSNSINGCALTTYFDTPSIYWDTTAGPQSINSVFGSNTTFMPAIKANDADYNVLPADYNSRVQECLNAPDTPVRFYLRNKYDTVLDHGDDKFVDDFTVPLKNESMTVFNHEDITGDEYFSYTYTSAINTDTSKYDYIYNDIPVKWVNDKQCYVADFGDQDAVEGDDITYSGKNYFVFGRSMSPSYIRSKINESTNAQPFTSVLFSATDEQQLGGFLVYNKETSDLMMYIANENNAEIDGRSYNLGFSADTYTEELKDENGDTVLDDDKKPIIVEKPNGGVILSITADNGSKVE